MYYNAFFEPEDYPELTVFNDNFESILKELQTVLKAKSLNEVFMPWVEKELYDETNPDGWYVAPLFINGNKLDAVCKNFPELTKIAECVPGIISCSFSMLKPGTKIAPHFGYDEYSDKILRYHMGLIIPEGDIAFKCKNEIKRWQPGKSFIFDDCLEHEAWNLSEEDRFVLIIDFLESFDEEKAKEISKTALPNEAIAIYFNEFK